VYDVIVVGARCAGSPLAMLLARRGHRVLLVDRAAFPSDTFRQHFIRQPGVARLARWGLLPRVIASGCPAVDTMTVDCGDFPLTGTVAPEDGVTAAYAPRRYVLDALLLEAAAAAGAEVRTGFAVDELLVAGGRVRGVRGRASGGPAVAVRARVVVGADGQHSLVARAVRAVTYHARPAVACYYHAYWSGVPVRGLEVYRRGGRVVLAFPTNEGRTGLTVGWPQGEFRAVRADVAGHYLAAVDLVPDLAARVRAGRREEPFAGSGDLPNFFRRAHGRGWALVGDAGYHKDPMLAYGAPPLRAELRGGPAGAAPAGAAAAARRPAPQPAGHRPVLRRERRHGGRAGVLRPAEHRPHPGRRRLTAGGGRRVRSC
jgi:flavin-dependent dehydrogenase